MRGRGGDGKEGNRKREGGEARGVCLLLNLNLHGYALGLRVMSVNSL